MRADSETKIAVFSHVHPSISKGGAEISAYALYSGLKELGYRVAFIAACEARDRNRILVQTEDEHIVVCDPAQYDAFYHVAHPDVVEQVQRLVSSLGSNLLFFHHFLAFGLNTVGHLAEGMNVLVTFHEFLALCHNHGQMITTQNGALCKQSHPARCTGCFPSIEPAQFSVRHAFIASMLTRVSSYISPSRFLMERFVQSGFPQHKFHVIENGLLGAPANAEAAADVYTRLEPSLPGNGAPFVVGFFGQLNPFKGLEIILEAAEHASRDPELNGRLVFRVHGRIVTLSDDLRVRLDRAVANGTLEYRGPYDNVDVIKLMKECTYILMASKWWENSPVVIQEAFLARRPLLVPDAGGMAEKVQQGVTGFRFRLGDPNDLLRVAKHAMGTDLSSFSFPQPVPAIQMAQSYLEVANGVQRFS